VLDGNLFNLKKEARNMQTIPRLLKPAQDEVHRTAHDQDLIEVPKRARLDREAEKNKEARPPVLDTVEVD
jgi:hypothetical protein